MKKKLLFVLLLFAPLCTFAEEAGSFAEVGFWGKLGQHLSGDVLALPVGLAALALSLRANRYVRLQVSADYRTSILEWYGKCIQVMDRLYKGAYDEKEKKNLIAQLYALSEEGRFMFPNINKKDGFRENMLIGFKWHDSVERAFLDAFRFQCESDSTNKKELRKARNNFTSTVFEFLKAERFIKGLNKDLRVSYRENKSIEDVEVFDGQF